MFYYTPVYTDPKSGCVQPGELDEEDAVIAPTQPYAPGTKSLLYDEAASRFVIASSSGLEGWIEKEDTEIESDYPGLLSGGE
jgi:hypothetical protein